MKRTGLYVHTKMIIETIVLFIGVHPPILHLIKKTKDRHLLSEFIINYLYEKTESETGSAKRDEILVEFSVVELKESYEKQQVLFQELTTLEDIEDTLFYLSRIGALQIEGGFLVIYNRMTIKRLGDTNIRYKQDDYRKLEKIL